MMVGAPTPTLLVFLCSIGAVNSQQRLGVAIGNQNINPDVVRREHYEYHAPGAHNNNINHRRRQAGPFDGIIPGILLTVASSTLQWWNEGRAVRDARMLSDAKRHVVELDSNAPITPDNEGKLIHITGHIETNNGIVDPIHGLHRPNALQLVRNTQAYQWREQRSESRTRVSERETRVQVEYRYHKSWTARPLDSNRFESPGGHFNPYPRYTLGKDKITAQDVRLVSNGLRIDPSLVDQIGNRDLGLSLSSEKYSQGHHDVRLGRGAELPYTDEDDAVIVTSSNALYFSETRSPMDLLALDQHGGPSRSRLGEKSTTNDQIAVIRSMPRPDVGDVRVSWKEIIPPQNGVSILAKQQGDKLVPWKHGDMTMGHQIYTLCQGKFSAQSMLEDFIKKNKFVTKIVRFGGWLGSFLGLNMILSCIPAIVKLLPLGVGRILQPIAQIATSTIAMGASVGLSAAVISVAWMRFRPVLAVGLAFVSGVGFFGPFFYARAKRSPEVKVMDENL